MDLKAYFQNHDGIGILATCDPNTRVDMALYVKPLVVDQTTIALIMRQRLSHQNLKALPNACYMFIEKGTNSQDFKGIRLYLTMKHEEINQSIIQAMRKKQPWIYPEGDDSEKYLVFFSISHARTLVGDSSIL
jgi:hypothetical protein